ncbi:MAG: hypothetical protein RL141_875 [Candidatus Parcubacteria bacterium]|jgi:hypothetical protein
MLYGFIVTDNKNTPPRVYCHCTGDHVQMKSWGQKLKTYEYRCEVCYQRIFVKWRWWLEKYTELNHTWPALKQIEYHGEWLGLRAFILGLILFCVGAGAQSVAVIRVGGWCGTIGTMAVLLALTCNFLHYEVCESPRKPPSLFVIPLLALIKTVIMLMVASIGIPFLLTAVRKDPLDFSSGIPQPDFAANLPTAMQDAANQVAAAVFLSCLCFNFAMQIITWRINSSKHFIALDEHIRPVRRNPEPAARIQGAAQ